jgi:hypothetical protein
MMPRRAATIQQADIARIIRAAKQEGASEVVVQMPGQVTIRIKLTPPPEKNKHFEDEEIIL